MGRGAYSCRTHPLISRSRGGPTSHVCGLRPNMSHAPHSIMLPRQRLSRSLEFLACGALGDTRPHFAPDTNVRDAFGVRLFTSVRNSVWFTFSCCGKCILNIFMLRC